jgi:hypothetical protein
MDPLAPEQGTVDETIHQLEDQGMVADTSSDLDVQDPEIQPPPPPMPPHSHDHEACGSSAVPPSAPPAIDLALTAILLYLTQQQAPLAVE